VLNLGPIYKDEMVDVMTPFMAALLGLGLNEAAYMAEICRAGLLAVDEGQTEAAQALGMGRGLLLRRVVLPQAMRVIIPPTGTEFINMLKTSSLVYVVTYNELLRSTSAIGSTSYAVMELLFVASIWYLVMTSVFSVFQYYLERYYARGSSRSLPPTPFGLACSADSFFSVSAFGSYSEPTSSICATSALSPRRKPRRRMRV